MVNVFSSFEKNLGSKYYSCRTRREQLDGAKCWPSQDNSIARAVLQQSIPNAKTVCIFVRFESRSKSSVKSYISIPIPPICIVSIPTVLQESISKLYLITEVLEVCNWLRLSHYWNFICHWLIGENMNLTCTAINEQLILSLIFSLVTARSSLCYAVTDFWCHQISRSIIIIDVPALEHLWLSWGIWTWLTPKEQ